MEEGVHTPCYLQLCANICTCVSRYAAHVRSHEYSMLGLARRFLNSFADSSAPLFWLYLILFRSGENHLSFSHCSTFHSNVSYFHVSALTWVKSPCSVRQAFLDLFYQSVETSLRNMAIQNPPSLRPWEESSPIV